MDYKKFLVDYLNKKIDTDCYIVRALLQSNLMSELIQLLISFEISIIKEQIKQNNES